MLENVRLHALLEGVAAAVVGLIAVTAGQLAWGLLAEAERRWIVAAILSAALAAIYLWRAKLASPVILLAAGVTGAALLA